MKPGQQRSPGAAWLGLTYFPVNWVCCGFGLIAVFLLWSCVTVVRAQSVAGDRQSTVIEVRAASESGESQVNSTFDDTMTIIDCEAKIREQRGAGIDSFLYARVELQALEAAKKYRLRVKVHNPTGDTIRFSDISATCGCAKVVAERNEIPAFGSVQVVMDLKVPNDVQGVREVARGQVGANFFSPGSGDSGFRMIVAYDLSSSFRFASDRVHIEIPENEKIVMAKVPVLITPPLTVDQLELQENHNLRDFSVKLIKDDPESTTPYVELIIPRLSVGRSGIVGDLILSRPGTDHVTGTVISVRHQENVSLRPESLRLWRVNQSKPFEATAMLRVSLPADVSESTEGLPAIEDTDGSDSERKRSPPPPEVELLIGGNPARVQVQRLGRGGFYRVSVRYDGPLEIADDTMEVRWRIVFDGRERVIDSHAFVPAVHRR